MRWNVYDDNPSVRLRALSAVTVGHGTEDKDPEEKTLRHSLKLAFLIVSAMMLCLIIPRKTRASQEMRTETFGYKRTSQRPETRAHEEDAFR